MTVVRLGEAEQVLCLFGRRRERLLDEYVASRRAAGMTRETVWSEQTPDGRLFAVVLMESDDVDAVFATLAKSDDPFTSRFRDFLKDVHGVDMIAWDEHGAIVDFTVMARPLRGLQALIEAMGAELQKAQG